MTTRLNSWTNWVSQTSNYVSLYVFTQNIFDYLEIGVCSSNLFQVKLNSDFLYKFERFSDALERYLQLSNVTNI